MARRKKRFKNKKELFRFWHQQASAILRQIFRNRKILVISEKGITSVPVSGRFQIVVMIGALTVMLWLSYSTGKYFAYDTILSEKEKEIWSTTLNNESLKYQVSDLHQNLSELNKYFSNIRQLDQMADKKIFDNDDSTAENKGDTSLDGDATEHAANLDDASMTTDTRKILVKIHEKIMERIQSIENIIQMTGIRIQDAALNNQSLKKAFDIANAEPENTGAQGGPFIPVDDNAFDQEAMQEDVEYLMQLEKFLHAYPISAPLNRYYVSSPYGKRIDPMNRHLGFHPGLDMVGPFREKVRATAPGVVVYARRYGGYGNFVMIDHGSGITTRYGHLNKILVKKGQHVKRGDVLGLEGTTGRSTGPHLHYEVRFNNKPLDPKQFLKAGKYVL